jgi:hypothetical protein
MNRVRPYTRPDRMQPKEFEERCRSVFGTFWRRPSARLLDRDPKMIRRYAGGDSVVPVEVAQKLLSITEIGAAAEIAKRVIITARKRDARERKHEHVSLQEMAHFLAIEIVAALKGADLLGPEK